MIIFITLGPGLCPAEVVSSGSADRGPRAPVGRNSHLGAKLRLGPLYMGAGARLKLPSEFTQTLDRVITEDVLCGGCGHSGYGREKGLEAAYSYAG